MDNELYMLVRSDTRDEPIISYVCFGYEEDVAKEMEYDITCFVNRSDGCLERKGNALARSWNSHCGCVRWWTLRFGPKPDGDADMFLVMKALATEDGKVTAEMVGYDFGFDGAGQMMLEAYGKELSDPSCKDGWDPHLCEICPGRAYASSRGFRDQLGLDVIQVVHDGVVMSYIYEGCGIGTYYY